jgi:hypothetical protein
MLRICDGVWCRRGDGKRLDLTQHKGESYVQAATIRAAVGRLFRGAGGSVMIRWSDANGEPTNERSRRFEGSLMVGVEVGLKQ